MKIDVVYEPAPRYSQDRQGVVNQSSLFDYYKTSIKTTLIISYFFAQPSPKMKPT